MLNKKFLTDVTREVLNHFTHCCSDFYGMCENASAIMYYIITNYTDEKDVHIMRGTFNDYDHSWIVVNGEIIDATVDQFSDCYNIYLPELYKLLYKEESENFTPLMADNWVEYIDNIFKEEQINMEIIDE